ncbi:MAG: tol-pal system-associated acyl-CoA thioesterase [Sulfurifustis sp.]
MQAAFAITIRIYYEDTDAVGIVYYANYLKFMERARTEWLRSLGFNQDELARDGVIFAVRSARIEFLKPARFNDVIEVNVRIADRGGASMTFIQTIRSGGVTLCEAETRVASLDATTLAPRPLPAALASRLNEVSA